MVPAAPVNRPKIVGEHAEKVLEEVVSRLASFSIPVVVVLQPPAVDAPRSSGEFWGTLKRGGSYRMVLETVNSNIRDDLESIPRGGYPERERERDSDLVLC